VVGTERMHWRSALVLRLRLEWSVFWVGRVGRVGKDLCVIVWYGWGAARGLRRGMDAMDLVRPGNG